MSSMHQFAQGAGAADGGTGNVKPCVMFGLLHVSVRPDECRSVQSDLFSAR